MSAPYREAILTFASITGVSESVAAQKLEEHGGNLNEAVNAHFNEGDRSRNVVAAPIAASAQDDLMDIDDPVEVVHPEPPFPLLSAGRRGLNPFSLLEDNLTRRVFDRTSGFGQSTPFVTHPRNVRQIPIEVKDENSQSNQSGRGPTVVDVTGTEHDEVPEVRGTVICDEEDDSPAVSTVHGAGFNQEKQSATSSGLAMRDYNDDIEEEMVRAAIEASKREIEGLNNFQSELASGVQTGQPHLEDPEIVCAASLSLKTAEQEKAKHGKGDGSGKSKVFSDPSAIELSKISSSNGRLEEGGTSVQEVVEEVEQPLVRHRTRRRATRSIESVQEIDNSPPPSEDNTRNEHLIGTFPSDEWGGISSVEHDEAVMLEAAMFGGIPEGSGYNYAYAPHQFMRPSGFHPSGPPRPPSPSLEAQRLIREQQDDEYLASLQADQEKELKAQAEAEARRLQDEAAREAALAEERRIEEETRRKQEEEQELERLLAAKEASLPQEPSADDENAITLLVRMPDGTRCGRRFLKSDKLQSLFDFIDVGRAVKPDTYRLVRPYPRRPFSPDESTLSLNELGLTSRQEALFLETM
ncbi:hypothetical protein MLD38_020917 [Melastoma candidum]|uniref:Uncharacterized protein n=1 Tax=Melastoma candidum TaxID=119954 RepID=A0ACB9QFQ5_9MYRT|nr:hypothetical protein MLD38_020917 [Melastoma candidum]